MSPRREALVSDQVVQVLPGVSGGNDFRPRGGEVFKPGPDQGDLFLGFTEKPPGSPIVDRVIIF